MCSFIQPDITVCLFGPNQTKLNWGMYFNACTLHVLLFLLQQTDQCTNNMNNALSMQPQMHTACTRDHNFEQILLNNDWIIF
jgi:membrane protein insertase Oxa1/YidC/SpoIIIJ